MTLLKFHAIRRVATALFLISGLCSLQQVNAYDLRDDKLNAFHAAWLETLSTCVKLEYDKSSDVNNTGDAFKLAKKALFDSEASSKRRQKSELNKALDDKDIDVSAFTKKAESYLGTLKTKFENSLEGKTEPPKPDGDGQSGLLAKVANVDPFKNQEVLFKRLSEFRKHYYPDGKPITEDGFDKLNDDKRIETIQKKMEQFFLVKLKKFSSDYKLKITTDADKTRFQQEWNTAHQEKFKEYATQVVNNKISLPDDKDCMFLTQPGFREDLRTFLKNENEKLNNSSDQTIKAETVDQRKTKLTKAAISFIQEKLLVFDDQEIQSVDDLDPLSKVMLNEDLTQYAKPLEPEHGGSDRQPTETGDNPRIAQHKAKVFEVLRNWMRVTSIFSMFTGGFGLEEFFFNKIVESLEAIVGKSLNSSEKAEVRAWAAELAREAHNNNPGPVVNQPTIGYPTLVPVMPVNPVYLRPAGSGHHFRKHFR